MPVPVADRLQSKRVEVLALRSFRGRDMVQAAVLAFATVDGTLVEIVFAAGGVETYEGDASIGGTELPVDTVAVTEALSEGGLRAKAREQHRDGNDRPRNPPVRFRPATGSRTAAVVAEIVSMSSARHDRPLC